MRDTREPLIMTPGPTEVAEEVRQAMARNFTNPDLDPRFFKFYAELCGDLQKIINTENQVLVLSGEGMLALDAALASLIEPGDRVLALSNGIFGAGLAAMAENYGADVVRLEKSYSESVTGREVEEILEQEPEIDLATVVHCETPAGMINPVKEIVPALNKRGIIAVVDAVSSLGGIEFNPDDWGADIVLGGSQKVLSAPPGLAFLSISSRAWEKIENRKASQPPFYLNLKLWQGWQEKQEFPYTPSVSDIYALKKAAERLLADKERYQRHSRIAAAVRKALQAGGLSLYPDSGYSDTVTAVRMPEGIKFSDLNREMLKNHGILIAGAFAELSGKVFRIGHMGENCRDEKLYLTLKALQYSLVKLGFNFQQDILKTYVKELNS